MLQNFIDYLEARSRIGSLYCWGAQGHKGLTDAQIRVKETSKKNADRVIALKNKRIASGTHPETIEYYDCSGLGMYWLQNAHGVYGYDMSADGMMSKCRKITRAELKPGDWVFRTYQSDSEDHDKGDAYHIGYVVAVESDKVYVIEAKGRDDGVVKRELNASGTSYWTDYGRPDCFASEIDVPDPAPKAWTVSRTLKLLNTMMTGEDVRGLQYALTDAGYPCGKIDGEFGGKTDAALRAWQAKNPDCGTNGRPDGKAGKKTIEKLGGTWTGK